MGIRLGWGEVWPELCEEVLSGGRGVWWVW